MVNGHKTDGSSAQSSEQSEQRILNAVIDNQVLKAWASSIGCLVDEVKVEISRTGWFIKCVEPAHVSMASLNLSRDMFRHIVVSSSEDVGMDIDDILDFLKSADKKGQAQVQVFKITNPSDSPGKDQFKIVMSSGIITKKIRSPDTSGILDAEMPDLFLPGEFTIDFGTLEASLKLIGTVSDHVIIEMGKDSLVFRCGYDDITKAVIPYSRLQEITGIEVKMPKKYPEMKSIFPLDYLLAFLKKSKALINGYPITVKMGSDYPIHVIVQPTEDDQGSWEFNWLLAPRIESE